jgi:hypothetical protein
MNCYFCLYADSKAQGQCRNDGRFVCRAHSVMRGGVLICYECANPNQDEILKMTLEYLASVSETTCKCCKRKLIPSFYHIASFAALRQEYQSKVYEQFYSELTYPQCPKGCHVCADHGPEGTVGLFLRWRCQACGKRYKSYTA